MATGKFDARKFNDLQTQLQALQDEQADTMMRACAKELAARLLAMTVKRTPVGQYPESSGKRGGTLRRGWKIGDIEHVGNTYRVSIENPTEYASYVEYGHRTRGGKGWVEGQFMLTLSENDLRNIAPAVLESKLTKLLKELH